MSDAPSLPDSAGVSATAAKPPQGTRPLRLIILLLILGAAVAGLLYDRTVARPAFQQANEKIEQLMEGEFSEPGQDVTVSPARVREVLGREPIGIEPLSNGQIEVYRWRGGLPFRNYHLYVVYTGKQLPLLYSATANTKPTGAQLPPETVFAKPWSQEKIDGFVPPGGVAGMGAGPGGKKGAKQGDNESPEEPGPIPPDTNLPDPPRGEEDDPVSTDPATEDPSSSTD